MSLSRHVDRIRARRLRSQADRLRDKGLRLVEAARRARSRANDKDERAAEIERRQEGDA